MLPILFINADAKEQAIVAQTLPNYSFSAAYSAAEARTHMAQSSFTVILIELDLPDQDGLLLLEELKALYALPPVVILSVDRKPSEVIRAMKAGAIEFISRPYRHDQLAKALTMAVCCTLRHDTASEASLEAAEPHMHFCIGSSHASDRLRNALQLYAKTDTTVLMFGETGCGKEVAARQIHHLSQRAKAPFVAINCGAIPHTLIESELYGTVEGVYTGAFNRDGYFERAHGGILFMDEIGEMPLESQVKLLRIIENRRFVRLGGKKEVEVDVRIIAATNSNLYEQVRAGLFRQDLFYRLNVLSLHIPPLRRRKEDIPDLVLHFLKVFGASEVLIEPAAMLQFIEYEWPGNIRELKNAVQRALVFSRGQTIQKEHIILGTPIFPVD